MILQYSNSSSRSRRTRKKLQTICERKKKKFQATKYKWMKSDIQSMQRTEGNILSQKNTYYVKKCRSREKSIVSYQFRPQNKPLHEVDIKQCETITWIENWKSKMKERSIRIFHIVHSIMLYSEQTMMMMMMLKMENGKQYTKQLHAFSVEPN